MVASSSVAADVVRVQAAARVRASVSALGVRKTAVVVAAPRVVVLRAAPTVNRRTAVHVVVRVSLRQHSKKKG